MRPKISTGSPQDGFALVATLSLLILLAVLALGMLSLSAISVRSVGNDKSRSHAQANARLALILALAELQKATGPDMRITAPADTIDAANPPLTGVWRSWEGSDHEALGPLSGRPKVPAYGDKGRTPGAGSRFLGWLVSGKYGTHVPGDAQALVTTSPVGSSVPLVSSGSVRSGGNREVHVKPVSVSDGGSMAWWVSGENQKAHVPRPYEPKNDTVPGWSQLVGSHSVSDPAVFGLNGLLADPPKSEKLYSRPTAELVADSAATVRPRNSFHDLSTVSTGLLTNSATGGWRKDLSLLTEKWSEQPETGLKFFQLSPSQNLDFTKPLTTDYLREGSLFYRWSDYRRTGGAEQTFHRRGPVASWQNLVNFATLYKIITPGTTGMPAITAQTWPYSGGDEIYNGLHKPWVMLQMARLQMIVSHYSTATNAAPGMLRPAVMYTPVFTLWNPFNTEVRFNGTLHMRMEGATPLALDYDGITNGHWAVQASASDSSYPNRNLTSNRSWQVRFSGNPLVMKPGETRVFSPQQSTPTDETYTPATYSNITLAPGYRSGGGFYYAFDRVLQPGVANAGQINPALVSMAPGTTLKPSAKFDVVSERRTFNNIPAAGFFIQWNKDRFGDPQHGNINAHYVPDPVDPVYQPLTGLASASLAECEGNPVPFMSIIYGSRLSNDKISATNGMVQASPLVTFTSSSLYTWYSSQYPGTDNPINAPWDLSFVPHRAGPGDDMVPNIDPLDNSGYIITGVRKAEGIPRAVMADIPLRPLSSLGDLTHWQVRGLNPIPPYAHNVIANSNATPLIPKAAIVNPNNARRDTIGNEQQDDSYCANHLLFDDWFFSSIAPDPTGFGPTGKTLEENYTDFITGVDPLANRPYRSIPADTAANPAAATATYNSVVAPADSWRTIASRFEVEGMFNVNSTSVAAWRALLGHARNLRIPYMEDASTVSLSPKTDYAFSRNSVAGNKKAGDATPGTYFATTEFTGYRVLDSPFLDKLAEKIVEQVKARGPFLSLSEFVNRQLSDNEGLALAGAIQAALDAAAKDPSVTDPFATLKSESEPSTGDPKGNDNYVFPNAAVGFNTYGLPGWTRQADILRLLAPILSARDDSFTIRAYGDARDSSGKILAKAWCEATVRRTREFSNPTADKADITTPPTDPTNQTYGRQYEIISFRWLSPGEV